MKAILFVDDHEVLARPGVPVIIVTGYGPIDPGGDASACLSKEDLFPGLLDQIRYYLEQAEHAPEELTGAPRPN